MKFLAVPLAEAEGEILGHNVVASDGRRVLRKGRPLSATDLETLASRGVNSVYVARLEPGDVPENQAARRIAEASIGPSLRLSEGATGRVNVYAEALSVVRVDRDRLSRLNGFEGVAFSTLQGDVPVPAGKLVATLKIVPYALPEAVVCEVEAGAASKVIRVDRLESRRVALIVHGVASSESTLLDAYRAALAPRVEALGSTLASAEFVAFDALAGEEQLSDAIRHRIEEGVDLLLLAGETAIMDRDDVAPRAIGRAGGTVEAYGAPVDPGNLLLLAYSGDTAIVGAPGCARSPKRNIVDLVLPRLLAGERLDLGAVRDLGYGGLLEEVAERGLARRTPG